MDIYVPTEIILVCLLLLAVITGIILLLARWREKINKKSYNKYLVIALTIIIVGIVAITIIEQLKGKNYSAEIAAEFIAIIALIIASF